MVQVFLNSHVGGVISMPDALADGASRMAGEAWPLFSPFIGGFGAAIAGSNTVSNMMFAGFQHKVGVEIGVEPDWINDGCLRTRPDFWPDSGGMDGFFAMAVQRST